MNLMFLKITATTKTFENNNDSNKDSNFERNVLIDTSDIDNFLPNTEDPILINEHANDDVVNDFRPITNASKSSLRSLRKEKR